MTTERVNASKHFGLGAFNLYIGSKGICRRSKKEWKGIRKAMKKGWSIGIYIISALLFLSYLIILGTSLVPKVCKEYELYYIEGKLQDWPGYGGLEYELGTPVVFTFTEDRTKRRGNSWNSFEEDGCWTYGDRSALYFSGIGKQDLRIKIEVLDVREGAESKVYVNQEEIGEIAAAAVYEFDVSGDLLTEDILHLEFLTTNFGAVGEDSRSQGIKIKEIVIDEADER